MSEHGAPRGSHGSGFREAPLRTATGTLTHHAPLVILLAIAAVLRSFRLTDPSGALIGDEVYYVQDARVILGLPVIFHHLPGSALSGLDPNLEHPPLGKLVMAGFIRIFGDRDFAWRIPSVILGTVGIALLYAIVFQLGGTRRQALFCAFLLAFENLSFVHGRIGTLDVYVTTFMLAGTCLYLASWYEVAGIVFGISMLCKMNGVGGIFAIALYEILLALRDRGAISWPSLRPLVITSVFCAAFFFAGLGTLDGFFTEFRSPWSHVVSMARFAESLTRTGPPQGSESTPLEWWVNSGVFNYYQVTTAVGGVARTTVFFRGAMNDYIIFAAPFALLYASRPAWSGRSRLAVFAVASFLGNFAPVLLAWAILSRMSYIYYMVPAMPAIICAIVLLATSVPRRFQWAFAAAVLYSFRLYFPFHSL
jgi:predicted membrane-bound dolichyl-phosphate-mannose-protein mannosyltransferase